MEKGQKFELKTFNGKATSDMDCNPRENYWELIGLTGTLINFAHELNFPYEDRVLIQFDANVNAKGLECHNDQPNSLWILSSDLERLK